MPSMYAHLCYMICVKTSSVCSQHSIYYLPIAF